MSEISPTLAEFRAMAAERRVISVYRRLLADTETAVGLYLKLSDGPRRQLPARVRRAGHVVALLVHRRARRPPP